MQNAITEDSRRGLVAGRYVLADRLGGGGTSDVYRAFDTLLNRPVAVKMFRPGTDTTAERRFEDEARLIAPLGHPGLVTIYDIGVEDDRAFMVLQLVDGVTLRGRLTHGPMPLEQVLELGVRLAGVLAYVHSRGIIHRDLKPGNVLIDSEQITATTNVYLADFGISRLVDSGHVTATGLAVGTAAYMAPEQVRGREVGPAADVYSLGLVLLECVTGHREYPGGPMETALARLSRPPQVPAALPEPLAGLLRAMTADDPRERPSAQRCAELFDATLVAIERGDAETAVLAGAPSGRPDRSVPATDDGPATVEHRFDADADADDLSEAAPFVPRRPAATPRHGVGRWLAIGTAAAALTGVLAASGPGTPADNLPRTERSPASNIGGTAPTGAPGQQAERRSERRPAAQNPGLSPAAVTGPASTKPKSKVTEKKSDENGQRGKGEATGEQNHRSGDSGKSKDDSGKGDGDG